MKRAEATPTRASRLPGLLKAGKVEVAVLGLGRIGLPTAGVFASAGAKVTGVDIKPEVVRETNAGRCWLVDEPGLAEMVKKAVAAGRLKATTDAEQAVRSAGFVIVCVPTPVDETKAPDYSAVQQACQTIGKAIRKGTIVVIESTVGPGIVEGMIAPLIESESGLKANRDFGLASCPERSDPGNILTNMKTLPRIVGGLDGETTDTVAALYEAVLGVKATRVSDPRTANAVKLTENLFRDVNIALANEFALLYEKLGIDSIEVIKACASKYNFMPHYPGAGVGGPCLPSNSYYLISEGLKTGNIPYLIRMAREINDRMPDHVVELVSEALNDVGKTVGGSRIAVLGVSYKPGIKDVQLTPVERIVERLKAMQATVSLYDPMFRGEKVFDLRVADTLDEATKGADCVVVGTAHREFTNLDLGHLASIMRSRAAFVDARGVVEPSRVRSTGLAFRGVGRKPS